MISPELVTPVNKEHLDQAPHGAQEVLQQRQAEVSTAVQELIDRLHVFTDEEVDLTIHQAFYMYREPFTASTFETMVEKLQCLISACYLRRRTRDPSFEQQDLRAYYRSQLERLEDNIDRYSQCLQTHQPAGSSGILNQAVYVAAQPCIRRGNATPVILANVRVRLTELATDLIAELQPFVQYDVATSPRVMSVGFTTQKVSYLAIMCNLLSRQYDAPAEKQSYFIGDVEPAEYVQHLQCCVDNLDWYDAERRNA